MECQRQKRKTIEKSGGIKMTTTSKIALVTGGSRGLGRNMAVRLAQDGKDVIITYLSQKEQALAVVAEIEKLGQKAAALQLDVGNIPYFVEFVRLVKQTLETLTKYLAKELSPRGITVNVLAPGAIETDFNNAAVRSNPQLNAFIASQTALGRAGRPDDIGWIVAFLSSEKVHWITGQRIEASGGMFL
jgi:NAD(P)-dependent dehydrogenase (short-subunit alcohol dehydrogenase family)